MSAGEAIKARLAELLAPRYGAVTIAIDDTAAKAGWSAETILFDARMGEADDAPVVSLVLKRQVAGHALLRDPDLALQWDVMTALENVAAVPTPKPVAFDRDGAILDQPAVIMTRMPGRIVPQNPNYNKAGWLAEIGPNERFAVWKNGITAMAAVHAVNWQSQLPFLVTGSGLSPGLPQWLGWIDDWLRWALAGRAHPVAEQAMAWLNQAMPGDAAVSLVWGDAIPANVLFDERHEVSGIIDWEFAALGPGEADLAWWLYFDELFSNGMGVARLPGLPTRGECVSIYEQAAGRPVRDLDYYLALAGLRMTIVSIRAVDRLVAQGRFKAANDAWIANPSSAWLSRHLGLGHVQIGPDFAEFSRILFGGH